MTASDLAAVVVTLLSIGVLAAAVVVVVDLRRATRRLDAAVERLAAEVAPAVREIEGAASEAHREIERIDAMLDRSELVAERVDAASRLAYSAFARPVVKAGAWRAGTTQAVRRLRGRS